MRGIAQELERNKLLVEMDKIIICDGKEGYGMSYNWGFVFTS